MSIYLLCECGKKLKARREHAGRKVMCSGCRRVWRLGAGSTGTTLALEPLALTEQADDASVCMAEGDDTSEQRRIIACWLIGLLMLAAFVVSVILLALWLHGLEAGTETSPAALRQVGISSHVPPAREDRVVSPNPKWTSAPGYSEQPQGDEEKVAADAKPQAAKEENPPASLPAPEIEKMEPAEPMAGQSVTILLRDREDRRQLEFRTGPDQPWQPVVEQRIKIVAPKEGPLRIEVRAIDPKGKPSPILQRNIPVKPALPYLSRLKVGDVLWQEVVMTRVSSFRLLGQDIAQDTQYSFLSRFTVEKKNPDGTLLIEQKVDQARMDKADPLMKELLGGSVEKAKGLTFRITLSPSHEILKLEGQAQPPQVFGGGNPLQAQAFLVSAFLDQDGWKELAQLSLFLPERELKPGVKWKRKLTHNWGPLGSWKGEVHYTAGAKQQHRQRIDYTLDLAYQPPAAGGTTGLPFKVQKPEFKPPAASGSLAFDLTHHLVAAADERFHVRGLLQISLLGADMPVEIDELQQFQVRLHQQRPRGW